MTSHTPDSPSNSSTFAPTLRPDSDSAAGSRFVQRIRRRYAADLALLPAGLPDRASMQGVLQALQTRGLPLADRLRIMRHLVQERLIVLDCDAALPLTPVVQAFTHLAEVTLQAALAECMLTLTSAYGQPLQEDGQPCALWIMGMGKLGARELNASSDIDLIYVYEADGQTAGNTEGRGRISNFEFFGKLVRAISAMVADVSEHGQVFRVDLALRPNGNSGPAAVSLAALEEYFLVQGREWERFAWLKSRAVACWPTAGDKAEDKERAKGLRAVIMPFVFRKRLDYGVFESLRQLHAQIRQHAAARAAGKSERECDVKLARGGIREIEFTVQLLQVVRGGQFAELRVRSTLKALPLLVQAGLMEAHKAQQLADAYEFLRRVEHRIQYLDDLQTHVLPTAAADLQWIAHTLGLPDPEAFFSQLQTHRQVVAGEFDQLLGGAHGAHAAPQEARSLTAPAWESIQTLIEACARQPSLTPSEAALYAELLTRLGHFSEEAQVRNLREASRERLLRLLERIAHWLQDGQTEALAVLRFLDWVQLLLRHDSYLALLQERPSVLDRLLRLLGAARWPARYLQRHPELIDELASRSLLAERFSPAQLRLELQMRLDALTAAGQDDDETLLNVLRRAHHAEVFRTLARDVEGVITVEQVADDLSLLADTMLGVTVDWCWQRLKQKHRTQPALGIIAYGKLGGKELGYGSDLDLVFVYADEAENAGEIYAAFVRKLINWMSVKTAEGDLFEIDMALRPNGNSGLLVTAFSAYADYQEQRGSNTAWVWEHQAMTRARFVWGSADLAAQFDAVRQAVLCAPRDSAALREEIRSMRERMACAYKIPAGAFDVKHSAGGMVDCEFAVQALVLGAAAQHPELIANVGNIALLQRADAAGLLPPKVGQAAADAYRELRRFQHKARLDEQPTQCPSTQLTSEQSAIAALWLAVFGAPRA